jgi:four helix bundle protein
MTVPSQRRDGGKLAQRAAKVNAYYQLNESLVWLRVLERRGILTPEVMGTLLTECDELCRILAASRKTAEKIVQRERIGEWRGCLRDFGPG